MRLVIREEAEQDIVAAMTWYAAKHPGLEQEFIAALDEVLAFLLRWPGGAKRIQGEVRSFPMERFPYSVIHAARRNELVVIRVYHQHRDPRRMLPRMRGRRS